MCGVLAGLSSYSGCSSEQLRTFEPCAVTLEAPLRYSTDQPANQSLQPRMRRTRDGEAWLGKAVADGASCQCSAGPGPSKLEVPRISARSWTRLARVLRGNQERSGVFKNNLKYYYGVWWLDMAVGVCSTDRVVCACIDRLLCGMHQARYVTIYYLTLFSICIVHVFYSTVDLFRKPAALTSS